MELKDDLQAICMHACMYIYTHIHIHTGCFLTCVHAHKYTGDARQLMAEIADRDIPEGGFRITYQMNTDEKKFTAIVRHFVRERVRLGMRIPDVIFLNTGVCMYIYIYIYIFVCM